MDEIRNKVAESGLITLSLEDYYPRAKRMNLDIAPWLYEGIMLREKEFRAHLKEHDWLQYKEACVAVYCSEDAIIPQWAYMLIGTYLEDLAKRVVYGSLEQLEMLLMEESLAAIDWDQYKDKRVIIKGCGDLPIPPQSYLSIAMHLKPRVKSLLFGEACSTVPIYKNKAKK